MSEHQSPVEDGTSAVSGNRKQASLATKLMVAGLMGVVLVGFVALAASSRHNKAMAMAATGTAQYDTSGQPFQGPSESLPPVPVVATRSTPSNLPQPAATSTFNVGGQDNSPAAAPIMAFSGSSALTAPAQPASIDVPPGQPAPIPPQPPAKDTSALGERLTPTPLDGEQATVLPNPEMVITEGTMIPCILQTAINSELPGLVTCVVPVDIRGAGGDVVLLDRGTKIVGQIETGLMQGQDRVFVDWTRAETPEHVIVTLDSPGSDELGRAGLPGAVDDHFWQRFGGAIMLTLVQGGLQAATIEAAGSGGGTGTTAEATGAFLAAGQSNGQQMANTALQNTINIAPTLSKNQGDTVSLIVAHDLDFSNVYKLQVNAEASNGG